MKNKWLLVKSFCLLIVTIFMAMLLYKIPGLYMDGVNPDYLAASGQYSDTNAVWVFPNLGFPLLGNWYHGVLTLICSMPFFRIFGTSILTIRLFYGIVAGIIVVLMYRILANIVRNDNFAFVMAGLLGTNIVYLFSFRTQHYIILFGLIPLLLSILSLFNFEKSKKRIYLILSGILYGIAFYDYFVFLFFVLAFIIWFIIHKDRRNGILWGISFLFGVIPYVLGYYMYGIATLSESVVKYKSWILIVIVLGYFIIGFIGYGAIKIKSEKNLTILLCGMLLTAITIIGVVVFKSQNLIQSMNINGGNSKSIIEKIQGTSSYIIDALSGGGIERMMFTGPLATWPEVLRYILIGCIVLTFILFRKTLVKEELNKIIFIFVLPIVYIFTSILFANRLNVHHYSLLLPSVYLILGISLDYIKEFKLKKVVQIVLIIMVFICNLVTGMIFLDKLQKSGGYGIMSEEINILAEEASDDYIYYFPEWGFFMPFKFLTSDSVEYRLEFDENSLAEVKLQKKKGYMCYWNELDTIKYENILTQNNMKILEKDNTLSRDGRVAFYYITFTENIDEETIN